MTTTNLFHLYHQFAKKAESFFPGWMTMLELGNTIVHRTDSMNNLMVVNILKTSRQKIGKIRISTKIKMNIHIWKSTMKFKTTIISGQRQGITNIKLYNKLFILHIHLKFFIHFINLFLDFILSFIPYFLNPFWCIRICYDQCHDVKFLWF